MIKIAFFGTPEFAGNILSGILEYSQIDCKLVVSQPDRPVGRRKELLTTPVKDIAMKLGIEVLQPEKIKNNNCFYNSLKLCNLDFIVVVAYGKIIPQSILDIPKYGCVNIHGSILPHYRGASPVQSVVKDGLSQTGLTIMCMSKGMDEGNILKIGKVEIDNVDTSEDIFKKFVHIGPELLVSTLKEIVSGDLRGTPQNDFEATYCEKISREDGEISLNKHSAQEIYNMYRAYTPWPGIYTWYAGKRLVLEKVSLYEILEEDEISGEVGEFIKLSKNKYGVICADKKILEIHKVKLEGKKSMDVVSFVNGNKEVVGYMFQ